GRSRQETVLLTPNHEMFLVLIPSTLVFLVLSIIAIDYLPVASARVRNLNYAAFCVISISATDAQMQSNIDWVCSQKFDCTPINPGGPCFEPNNLRSHASFVMNRYYQKNGREEEACDFSNTGRFINSDPSYGDCVYDY
ncbi:unnamed protein product, partial [Brassica oleracea]